MSTSFMHYPRLEDFLVKTFRASVVSTSESLKCHRETTHGKTTRLRGAAHRLDAASEMTSLNTSIIRSTSPRSGLTAVIPM